MRIPAKPPIFGELLSEAVEAQRFDTVFKLSHSVPSERGYYHWDDLRRRPARAGFTVEERWLAVKLSRLAAYRRTPLLDQEGDPFQYFVPDSLQDLLHEIDLGAGGSIGMPQPIADAQTRDRYIVNSLIQEAITSSQLEGAATTREVAKEMIRTGRKPRDRSEQMILNNYITMQQIIEVKGEPLTPAAVLHLHRGVTEDTLDDESSAGRFRREDEDIRVFDARDDEVLHVPPAASELEARMQSMCDFANGKTPKQFVHPVVRAIILHFWLAYDHPFTDGNGRTARALFYWSMLHHGYWLFEFVSISTILLKAPAKYARAFLHTETDDNDLNYFILYQAEIIRRAIRSLHDYIDRKQKELAETESALRFLRHLNHRQQALIGHALRHPLQQYTVDSHRTSHRVAYATARSDLLELVKLGLLSQDRRGKAMIFQPLPGLTDMLRQMSEKEEKPAPA